MLGWRICTAQRSWGWSRHWTVFAEWKGFRQRVSEVVVDGDGLGFPRSLSMLGLGRPWWILLHFVRKVLVARAGIHIVAKCERDYLDTATYHLSNHFRNKTPLLLHSKICLSLACSRGSRRHLWSLSVCNQILSFGEQTSRTWFFIVMTVFSHK